MPNCFQLTRKSEPEKGPVVLQTIDDEMRVHFKAPADPDHWYCFWYDIIGFALACGRTFDELKERYEKDNASDLLAITNWLDANFTTSAWYSPFK